MAIVHDSEHPAIAGRAGYFTMTVVDDVREIKDATIAVLDELIVDVIANKNDALWPTTRAQWSGIQYQLERLRSALVAQAYERASEDAQPALDALALLGDELARIAARMTSAAEFNRAFDDLEETVNNALSALKKKN